MFLYIDGFVGITFANDKTILFLSFFLQLAVKHILANKSAIQKEDGLADYHYEGSDRWSAKERLKFREALTLKGKNFFQISKEVRHAVWNMNIICIQE